MGAGLHRLHYSYSTPPSVIQGGITTENWWGPRKFAAVNDQIMAAGGEVLQYSLIVSDVDFPSDEPEVALAYLGKTGHYAAHSSPREWFWDHTNPSRVMIPAYGSYVMDMREDSAYTEHLLNDYFPNIAMQKPGWRCNGSMSDVMGDGYWGAYSGLSASEKDEMSHGQRVFLHKLRQLFGESLIIVINNAVNGPIDDVDGIMIENHNPSEAPFWKGQMGYIRRVVRRRNITLNPTVAEATAWSKVAGVDAVTYTAGNYQLGQICPGIVIGPLPGHVAPGTPVTPPEPPPVPDVPPYPTGLVVTKLDGKLHCTWDAVPGGAAAYQVYDALSGSIEHLAADIPVVGGVQVTTYDIPDLTNGQQYSIRVGASAAVGSLYGPWSPAVLQTPEPEVPVDPEDPCLNVKADLAAANATIATRDATITALQGKISNAQAALV